MFGKSPELLSQSPRWTNLMEDRGPVMLRTCSVREGLAHRLSTAEANPRVTTRSALSFGVEKMTTLEFTKQFGK